jgi:hypothetical protein
MRRRIASGDGLDLDVVFLFSGSPDDTFIRNWFGDGLFPDTAAARQAWPRYRRAVWARTDRCSVPHAATVFDGITHSGAMHARWAWQNVTFPLAEVLAALEADRAHLAAFERADPAGAREIADYLELLREDFGTVERVTRALARQSIMARTYPAVTLPGGFYSGPAPDGVRRHTTDPRA